MALLVSKVPVLEGVRRAFFLSVIHKSCVLLKTPFLVFQIPFFFPLCFPLFFLFSLSKLDYFLVFIHQPLFGKHFFIGGGGFCFPFLLPFPMLMFACFTETDVLNIPFFKTNLF